MDRRHFVKLMGATFCTPALSYGIVKAADPQLGYWTAKDQDGNEIFTLQWGTALRLQPTAFPKSFSQVWYGYANNINPEGQQPLCVGMEVGGITWDENCYWLTMGKLK